MRGAAVIPGATFIPESRVAVPFPFRIDRQSQLHFQLNFEPEVVPEILKNSTVISPENYKLLLLSKENYRFLEEFWLEKAGVFANSHINLRSNYLKSIYIS